MIESFFILEHRNKTHIFVKADLDKKGERERLIRQAKQLGRRWTIFSLFRNQMIATYEEKV